MPTHISAIRRLIVFGLTITTITAAGLGLPRPFPGLRAEEAPERKPLPSFLRNPVLADRYLSTRDVQELLQFERAEPVCRQLLKREGVPLDERRDALVILSRHKNVAAADELLALLSTLDADTEGSTAVLDDLATLLAERPRGELAPHRETLQTLATEGQRAATRQGALAGLIVAHHAAQPVWQLAAASPERLLDLLRAIPRVEDEVLQSQFIRHVESLLSDPPSDTVRQAAIEAIVRLPGNRRQVFEMLVQFIEQGIEPATVIRGLSQLPKESRSTESLRPLAEHLLAYLQGLPLEQRSGETPELAVALVNELVADLPSADAAQMLERLDQLRVRTYRLKTLEEQMAYDQTVLVVPRDRPIQIVLTNDDIMPHNLVVVRSPEARIDVGVAADQMQNQPDALQKGYLPESDQILKATRMLQSHQVDTITFQSPQETGVLPFLCTFPGHWIKMYGAILVVDDVDAYLAANRPLPTADQLLGIRKVEWQFEQLAADLHQLPQGRSFERGKQLFLRTSCYSCHKINQVGSGVLGPDLTKISEKYPQPQELLRQIMNPSDKVDEQYATVIIYDQDGRDHQGVVIQQTAEELWLKQNPLSDCEPKIFRIADVEIERSRLSPMPENLLNTITAKEHVYDLLAFIIAGGRPEHPLFQTGDANGRQQ